MSVFKQFQVRIGYYAAFGGICLIWLTGQNLQAFSLLGIEPKMFNRKINEMNESVQKQFSENRLKLTGLESRIGKVETNISVQTQAVAKVQAGYDRSQTQAAGRDITTTTTNDSRLMEKIFQGLTALFFAIIGILKALLIAANKKEKALNERISYLTSSRRKYQDLWIMKLDPQFAKLKKELEETEGIKACKEV